MSCNSCGQNIVAGAVKLLKSELGIGMADAGAIAARRSACEACPEWDHGRCGKCGCYTWGKTRLSAERCPLGKWEAS